MLVSYPLRSLILLSLAAAAAAAAPPATSHRKLQLTDTFHCEGAFYADFNRDGKMDVVSGPYWYAGPDFQQRHEIREPHDFDPKGYSDNFLTYTGDFNGDGWADVLYVPWPGKDASWYENLAGEEKPWAAHFALKNVGNESPVWGDVNGDGRPDLVFNIDGFLGYGTWDPGKPDQPWVDTVVNTVGLADRLSHRPSELSGGQQQRVAVARALASQPEIIFADEPTGNLDSRSGADILKFMRAAVDELGQTIVMVTHDPTAAAWADRVVFLADGRIVDEMTQPTAERVLDYLKHLGD